MAEMSLLGFMAHIANAQAHHAAHMEHALERAAVVVEKEAKSELGTYQDAAPPLAGWAELADRTKDERVALGYSENEPGLRSGDMRESVAHEVEHNVAIVGSPMNEMLWFELGTAKQPPRSALGGALVRKSPEVVRILAHGTVSAILDGVGGVPMGLIP